MFSELASLFRSHPTIFVSCSAAAATAAAALARLVAADAAFAAAAAAPLEVAITQHKLVPIA